MFKNISFKSYSIWLLLSSYFLKGMAMRKRNEERKKSTLNKRYIMMIQKFKIQIINHL